MPFSWKKKTKRNRFSQLVADHLQSPKRGGSLVVETGFPTSIIDLYVRNRGRFRKSSVKKQSECEFESNDSSNSFVGLDNLTSGGSDHAQVDEIVEEIEEIDELVGVRSGAGGTGDDNIGNSGEITELEVELSVEMVRLNPVLVGLLKGLLVMGLVVLTKGFTIGITVLAFVLILLESVAKRWSFDGAGDVRSLEESEVEYVESKPDEVLEIEGLVEPEIKRKGSRRAVMKSRMKKLVPKKLRKSSVGSKEEIVKASECSDSKGEIVEVDVKVKSSGIEGDGEGLGTGVRSNSGCLVLCLVVLVGLIGGRVLALVLALSWCLMLKTLRWRNVKFPVS